MRTRTPFSPARFSVALAALVSVAALTACESKLNQENYDKITVGMDLTQVERILGKGEEQANQGTSIGAGGLTGGAGRNSQKTYVWHEPNKDISVVVAEGKVVSKNKSGL